MHGGTAEGGGFWPDGGTGTGTGAGSGPDAGAPGVPGPRRAEPGGHRAGHHGGSPPGRDGGEDGPQHGGPQHGGGRHGGPQHGGGHRRGGARGRGRKKPVGRRRKILKWTAIGTCVAVLGTAGAAFGYYEYLASKIQKGERVSGKSTVHKAKANADGTSAMNILIIGSDNRDDPEDAKLGGAKDAKGERADVIMIAHLSADRSNMSVVSIPRDTRVQIPECTDPKTHHVYAPTEDIINASLTRGGAGCTLATVQNLTKVYIDHWMMIRFHGVVEMARVVGGVDVCVEKPVYDHPTASAPGTSHLLLKKAGKQTITDPEMALAWLRARHPFMDDAGRAEAQHMYMNSLIRKLRGENLFSNPAKLNDIATTAMSAFVVSEEIGTPKKLYDLGMQLKTVPPNRISMATMPHDADPEAPKAHYIPSKDADTVWSLLRNDTEMDPNGKPKSTASPTSSPKPSGPPAGAPATVAVTVVNGTAGNAATGQAVPGRAGDIADALKAAGYTQADFDKTPAPNPATTVVYPASGGAQAKADATAVAGVLKIPVSDVKASPDVEHITLTIGADWRTGTDFAKTAPKAGGVPKSAQVVNGAEEGCMPVYWPYVYHGK
ncbi:LCP family protein [Streptomyces sp. NRRL F-5123]|uniref:LCP family protein n=1 Tax=Streptomyces sp. NRRL F-5123 TaxID=1463856 RepID=UPI0006950E47|nr:LCP family protein [Streptomyces sp. NRRL F-5123]